ncbi:MAG: flagellar hook assembly protein FlgD [bacterium]
MIATNTTQTAVQQATPPPGNGGADSKSDRGTLGKEDFLTLLMAQVTNQNPLNPMDSQGMMDQLTQMGSMEQLINLNSKVDILTRSQEEIVRSSAYSFLNKDVTVRGGQTQVTGGSTPRLQFQLPREAAQVRVLISNSAGLPVRSLDLGGIGSGLHQIGWDGRDTDGDLVSDGVYRYSVIAKSTEDESLPVHLLMRGKVSGVKFQDGRPLLMMGGGEFGLRDILEIASVSQDRFANREPRPLAAELKPKPPADDYER